MSGGNKRSPTTEAEAPRLEPRGNEEETVMVQEMVQAQVTAQVRSRTEHPARWMKAAERAISEGIQVRQLAGSGQWIASSGSDSTVAMKSTSLATSPTAATA